ncbi:putative membrane protein [Desulfitobacterium dichloroeliminans LMG P-21439]|uniref:Putative membrane protein n=1 Tax=Desulfitobacterium dichloroeliminans (strain LMG P-21439 / DCA1) TaxID=871963 RepID=L0F6M5_DESDL|nr:heparan-alpha-glucosaminide N-acetyltransferase [Desulfitobacterium dichloroeliminans]AGA68670.1 putative membrane protein [Desulfitobacterium dichloroeliminans LMG P-21439]
MEKQRILEIDILRTIAIILMVVFHFIYDLDTFTNLDINVRDPFWYYIGRVSAFSFMFVSGVSSCFSRHPVKNGIKIFAYGLGITVVTFIFLREDYVRFGILHFLGISMVLNPLFSILPRLALIPLALFSFLIGQILKISLINSAWLLPIGVTYPNFSSIDYYPLFPYIGVTILGVFFYRTFYINGKGLLDAEQIPILNSKKPQFLIRMMSHHSLGIYLIHQLILLSIIFLVQAALQIR